MALFSSRHAQSSRHARKQTAPQAGKCKITVLPSGIIELVTPYKNDAFQKEFAAICKKRLYLEDRKLWQVHSQYVSELVDLVIRHFGEVEGLDKIYANPYDTLHVLPSMPTEIITAVVKAYRVHYAPDRAATDEKRDQYTRLLQEVAEAFESIKQERSTNGV